MSHYRVLDGREIGSTQMLYIRHRCPRAEVTKDESPPSLLNIVGLKFFDFVSMNTIIVIIFLLPNLPLDEGSSLCFNLYLNTYNSPEPIPS